MKNLLLLLTGLLLSGFLTAADNFVITWKYIHVVSGYDHANKIKVYIDGNLQAESTVFKQTEKGKLSLSITPGNHQIRVVSLAQYEGQWEEHTVANNYSIDALYESQQNFKKKGNTLNIIWDIENVDTKIVWGGSGKTPKASNKTIPVTISWEFKGIESGYDHECRMVVSVNGQVVQTSGTSLESAGGKMIVLLPQGDISLKIMNEALFEGNWEEHTIANSYSVDCFLIGDFTIKKQKSVHLLFDIDQGETTVTWK